MQYRARKFTNGFAFPLTSLLWRILAMTTGNASMSFDKTPRLELPYECDTRTLGRVWFVLLPVVIFAGLYFVSDVQMLTPAVSFGAVAVALAFGFAAYRTHQGALYRIDHSSFSVVPDNILGIRSSGLEDVYDFSELEKIKLVKATDGAEFQRGQIVFVLKSGRHIPFDVMFDSQARYLASVINEKAHVPIDDAEYFPPA